MIKKSPLLVIYVIETALPVFDLHIYYVFMVAGWLAGWIILMKNKA